MSRDWCLADNPLWKRQHDNNAAGIQLPNASLLRYCLLRAKQEDEMASVGLPRGGDAYYRFLSRKLEREGHAAVDAYFQSIARGRGERV